MKRVQGFQANLKLNVNNKLQYMASIHVN